MVDEDDSSSLNSPVSTGSELSLSFFVDPSTHALMACFDPAKGSSPDSAVFNELLAQQGYAQYALNKGAIGAFLTQIRTQPARFLAEIGRQLDAEIRVIKSNDDMTAWLSIIAAQGGRAATVDDVMRMLRSEGVQYGIISEAITECVAAGHCDNVVIARGLEPTSGTPGWFENLLDEKEKKLSEVDENAVVKFSDLGHLLLVKPGEELMRMHQPIQGENGKDIHGQIVFAKPLEALKFSADSKGVVVDKVDPNLLRAATPGQPSVVGNWISVNPVIEVGDVDLTTGNIVFEGSIHIAGDVKTGMRVSVTGDVLVTGTIESCEVHAGGNIEVRGGIIGHGDAHLGSRAVARVRAKGSVHALFAESAYVEAGESIHIDRSARMCELFAEDEIVVGATDPRQSVIVGGVSQASRLVRAATIGSAANINTIVRVGVSATLAHEFHELVAKLEAKGLELDQVMKLDESLRNNPAKAKPEIRTRLETTRLQLIHDIEMMLRRKTQVEAEIKLLESARIEVKRQVFYGAEIQIGNISLRVDQDRQGGTFHLSNGQIVIA